MKVKVLKSFLNKEAVPTAVGDILDADYFAPAGLERAFADGVIEEVESE